MSQAEIPNGRPSAVFCPACGAPLPDDAAFCARCGGAVSTYLTSNQAEQGSLLARRAVSWGWALGFVFLGVALIVSYFIITSNGGNTDPGDDVTRAGSESRPPSSLGTAVPEGRSGSPSGTPAKPVLKPAIDPPPKPYVVVPGRPETTIGPSREDVVIGVRTSLNAAGFDLTGVEVYAFQVMGTGGQTKIIFEFDSTNPNFGLSKIGDDDKGLERFLATVFAAPEVVALRLNSMVFNFKARDNEGPFSVRATFSGAAVQALANGQPLTDAQMKQDVVIEGVRGNLP